MERPRHSSREERVLEVTSVACYFKLSYFSYLLEATHKSQHIFFGQIYY